MEAEPGKPRPGRGTLAFLAMIAAVLGNLWPIGLGGRMPIGGDVTAFSIGPMAVLSRSLKAGRLPLWNDLWGYGFPALAESQMGVFYPLHLILYGLLTTEAAFTASLVLHALFAAAGTFWAARRFGVGPVGSALAGFAWTCSGFFQIHLSHHWAYPTASWMPWAWGLAWKVAQGGGGRRSAALLASALALQALLGHFQLGFQTGLCVGIIAAWTLIDHRGSFFLAVRRSAAVAAALLASLLLAWVQIGPTWDLARLTESSRTPEYLGAFASPPTHFINLIAPELFHRSSLWRSVAWDPFRAMPEEHLPYLGLIPLFLALVSLKRLRGDPPTRLLMVLCLSGLVLSFGPYAPGFAILVQCPGFSFFRAPARWDTSLLLALAILAGKGLDLLGDLRRPGRALALFSVLAGIGIGLAVLTVEAALASGERPEAGGASGLFDRAFRLIPDSEVGAFSKAMRAARTPPTDPIARLGLIREGARLADLDRLRFDRKRFEIYGEELIETGLFLVIILAFTPTVARHRRVGKALLLLCTLVDLTVLARHRGMETAPIRPLTKQSTVLARMAAEPYGARTVDGLRNLPMVAGMAPVAAYRTLDRPAVPGLAQLALGPPSSPTTLSAIRAVGATLRVFEPLEVSPESAVTVHDPELSAWIYGRAWSESAEGRRARGFRLWRPVANPTRAWFVSGDGVSNEANPEEVLRVLAEARPLEWRFDLDRREMIVDLATDQAGWVIVSQLDDPGWSARWTSGQKTQPAWVHPAFGTRRGGAWQAVQAPGPGRWTLQLTYASRPARIRMIMSAGGWLLAIAVIAWPSKRTKVG